MTWLACAAFGSFDPHDESVPYPSVRCSSQAKLLQGLAVVPLLSWQMTSAATNEKYLVSVRARASVNRSQKRRREVRTE